MTKLPMPKPDFLTKVQSLIVGLLLPAILWVGTEFMRIRDTISRTEVALAAVVQSAEQFKMQVAQMRESDQREHRLQIDTLMLRVTRMEVARERDEQDNRGVRDAVTRLAAIVERLERRLDAYPIRP